MPDSVPLLVAHRAGNDIDSLLAAEAAGVDLVEADIWLWRGRVEVRHSKTMGPVPLLWDRWMLAPGWTPRLLLDDVVSAARSDTEFYLDLKGGAPELSELVAEAMTRLAPGRPYTVSSQSWDLLEPFEGADGVRVIYSIGSRRMLRAIPKRLRDRVADGIGINQRLLTPARISMLRELAPAVFTWPVNSRTRFDELAAWGVDGVISDKYALIRQAIELAPNA
jgi:glycerophosphoryl diester phosphodiesterase